MNDVMFVLTKVSQTRGGGIRSDVILGIFNSRNEIDNIIETYKLSNPSTNDNQYFFQIDQCKINQLLSNRSTFVIS